MRAETLSDLAEDEASPESEPESIGGSAPADVLALPGVACLGKKGANQRIALREGIFNAAPDALEKRWHIEEVVGSREADFVGKAAKLGGECENAFAGEAGENQYPGGGKIEGEIVKNAVGLAGGDEKLAHELIQALVRASQHVRQIADAQTDSLGFS
jgi:hypothetical protein